MTFSRHLDFCSKFFSATMFVLLLISSGCMTPGPENMSYSVENISEPSPDRGIVFGKRCEGGYFSVKSMETGEEFVYSGSVSSVLTSLSRKIQVFALNLPEGQYEISSLSAGDHPSRISHNPFSFTVSKGKVKYIGTIIKSWSIYTNNAFYNKTPEKLRCDDEHKAIIKMKLYRVDPRFFGFNLSNKPDTIPVYVANYPESVLREMRDEFPNLNLSNFEIDIMK